jgi:hypothetical protein
MQNVKIILHFLQNRWISQRISVDIETVPHAPSAHPATRKNRELCAVAAIGIGIAVGSAFMQSAADIDCDNDPRYLFRKSVLESGKMKSIPVNLNAADPSQEKN